MISFTASLWLWSGHILPVKAAAAGRQTSRNQR